MIRRVRTSLVALIPPNQGIRATLATTGLSRVVIANGGFRSVVVRRDPELVALTSPLNATGLFELDIQSELLLPFEMMGVDTSWELQMPKRPTRSTTLRLPTCSSRSNTPRLTALTTSSR